MGELRYRIIVLGLLRDDYIMRLKITEAHVRTPSSPAIAHISQYTHPPAKPPALHVP
jgi:hypothetical protein